MLLYIYYLPRLYESLSLNPYELLPRPLPLPLSLEFSRSSSICMMVEEEFDEEVRCWAGVEKFAGELIVYNKNFY